MKTKQEILELKKNILLKNNHHEHSGLASFWLGMFLWVVIFIGLGLIVMLFGGKFNLTIFIASIFFGFSMSFIDSENAKRNELITVENRFTNEAICNFVIGRHWTRFFFYRRKNKYDNTPFEIENEIRETVNKNDIPIIGSVKLLVQLADGLAFEDVGVDDALEISGTEARDAAESFIKNKDLDTLERNDKDEIDDFIDNHSQIIEILDKVGLLLIKIDFIDLSPTEDYKKSRLLKKQKEEEAKAKKIESGARQKRISVAKNFFKKIQGISESEAVKMAIDKIDKEDGFKKESKISYEGLGGNQVIVSPPS